MRNVFSQYNNPDVPEDVKLASRLMLAYAVWVLAGALVFGLSNNFADMKGFARAVLRFAGMTYIGLWLLTLQKQAWWFAVCACALLALFGIVGIGIFGYLSVAEDPQYRNMAIKIVVPALMLGYATWLLLKPATKGAFNNK